MVNKNPNVSGLRQNKKKARSTRAQKQQTKADLARAQEEQDRLELEKKRANIDLLYDTYLIAYMESHPNDPQLAKEILKAKTSRKASEINPLLGEE